MKTNLIPPEYIHANKLRTAEKWVRSLILDGRCLVCGCTDFHDQTCEVAALLDRLRKMR